MGMLSLPNASSIPTKDWGASPAAEPIKQEERADVFVNASVAQPVMFEANSGDVLLVDKEEKEQLLKAVKEEDADDFFYASSSMPVDLEAKNGDAPLITEVMKKEEEQLVEAWIKLEETEEARKREEAARLGFDPEAQYNKLDELLTKTQLFSDFLLETMDQMSDEEGQAEEPQLEEKKGSCRKRKAKPQYNDKKAKTAVAAMLTRSLDDHLAEDFTHPEEERWEKEQANLVPLLTGGKLKSYQIKGVKWLISLWKNGLNGILADQMGLGKTIQAIGFLAHLKGKGVHGPYLIIAPLSTLSNWVNEISRFTPSLASIIYHGDKVARAEIRQKIMPKTVGPDFPIVVTSYEMAMSDAKFLAAHTWKYVIVDEGHQLKIWKCKLLKEMKHIPMDNKLLLIRTPLQNNLAELWSLLNFILPQIFSSHQEFELWSDFSGKGSEEQQETEEKRRVHVVSKLHAILRPFLLRRMKEDVEQVLPRKKKRTVYASTNEHQKQIQDHLVHKTFDNYLLEEIMGAEAVANGQPPLASDEVVSRVLSQNNSNTTFLKNAAIANSSLKSHSHDDESLHKELVAEKLAEKQDLREQVEELKKNNEALKEAMVELKKQLEDILMKI